MSIDLSTPRTQRKVQQVLAWCRLMLNELKPLPIHNRTLVRVFGGRGAQLATQLKHALLVRHGGYVVGKAAYGYTLNRLGYAKLLAQLDDTITGSGSGFSAEATLSTPEALELVISEHAEELRTLTFTYKLSSNRFWHPLQNIRREHKQQFWAAHGLAYDYDIQACAPTVLLQLAKRFGLPAAVLEPVQAYLNDRGSFRRRVAALAGCSEHDAKRLVNSLFNGARLSPHWSCNAYALCGYDEKRLHAVKNDAEVCRLQAAIKAIWRRLQAVSKLSLSTGGAKWAIYFKHERAILKVITRCLDELDVRYFTEHDGFRSSAPVSTKFLEDEISRQLGFHIKLDAAS